MRTLKATLLLLALSIPLWAANHPEKPPEKDPDRHGKHDSVAVPEGGAAITYLLVSWRCFSWRRLGLSQTQTIGALFSNWEIAPQRHFSNRTAGLTLRVRASRAMLSMPMPFSPRSTPPM